MKQARKTMVTQESAAVIVRLDESERSGFGRLTGFWHSLCFGK
jgi:hypothetical protein